MAKKKNSRRSKSLPVLGTALVALPLIQAAQVGVATRNAGAAVDSLGHAFLGYLPSKGQITWGQGGGWATISLVIYALVKTTIGRRVSRFFPKGFTL